MTEMMKTFVMKEIGVVDIMEKPLPPASGSLDAIVKTTAAMVWTSDCHTVNGAVGPRTNQTLVPEGTGIVQEVRSAVKTVVPEDEINLLMTACAWNLRKWMLAFFFTLTKHRFTNVYEKLSDMLLRIACHIDKYLSVLNIQLA